MPAQLTGTRDTELLQRRWDDVMVPPYSRDSTSWNAVVDIVRVGGDFVINGAVTSAARELGTYSLCFE